MDDSPPAHAKVASFRHTAILSGVFVAIAVYGAVYQSSISKNAATANPATHPNVIPLYLSLIAMEWGLVLYVWRAGLRRTGTRLADLVGGRWKSPLDVARDIALGLLTWGIWSGVERAMDHWIGSAPAGSLEGLLPQRAVEIVLWILVSLSAGFAEELTFRGYFMRQYTALTRRPILAFLLQALLFGISHGYQGVAACVKITVYAFILGGLAWWRGSLRPGMVAHAWTDISAGWLGI